MKNMENTKFFLSCQVLFELIRFKIVIYLVVKQNVLNLAPKVEFMKLSTMEE